MKIKKSSKQWAESRGAAGAILAKLGSFCWAYLEIGNASEAYRRVQSGRYRG